MPFRKSVSAALQSTPFGLGVLALILLSLVSIALVNRDTPFRGEHWALLYAFVKSPTWFDKIRIVTNIEVFGDHRFQPFNSMPMIVGYLIFGAWFLGYYLLSIGIHFAYAVAFAKLLDLLRFGEQSSLSLISLIKKYALEIALILILFPCIDVLTWTYYHYIQIAATLATYSVYLYLKNVNVFSLQKAWSYLLILVAVLIYEPFIVLFCLFLAANTMRWISSRRHGILWETLIPGIVVLVIASQYLSNTLSASVTIPPNVSVLNGIQLYTGHDALFLAPFAKNKFIFCLYNLSLMFLNVFRSVLFPALSHKVNIYELQSTQQILGSALPYAAGSVLVVIFGASVWVSQQKQIFGRVLRTYAFMGFSAILMFLVICWGRPEAGHYSSVQFRYVFILLPFIFAILLDSLGKLTQRKGSCYAALLVILIAVNLGSTLNQGMRLSEEMGSLSTYVKELKRKGLKTDELVVATSKAINDYSISVPGDDVFLIYNGRGGLTKYFGKM